MERKKKPTWRGALCGALTSLAVYLLGLLLWTHLTLCGAVRAEQLTLGVRLAMALAAAVGVLVCRLRGEAAAAPAVAAAFWALVALGGLLCGGTAAPGEMLRQGAAAAVGAAAAWLPARGRKKRRFVRGKHKR